MFYVCKVIGFVDWLDRGLIYICEKSLEMCICLWPEFDCPEVTLCSWQDIKIQFYYHSCVWILKLSLVWSYIIIGQNVMQKQIELLSSRSRSQLGSLNQNMTVSIISAELLIILRPNLVWWCIIVSESVSLKLKDCFAMFKVKVTMKVQNFIIQTIFSESSSRVILWAHIIKIWAFCMLRTAVQFATELGLMVQ